MANDRMSRGSGGILNSSSADSAITSKHKTSHLFNRLVHARDFANRPSSSGSTSDRNLEPTISFHEDVGREDYGAMRQRSANSTREDREGETGNDLRAVHSRVSSQGDDEQDEQSDLLIAERDRDSETHRPVSTDERSNGDDDEGDDPASVTDTEGEGDGDGDGDTATLSSVDMNEYRPHYVGRSVVRRLVSRVRGQEEEQEGSDEEEVAIIHTYRKAPIFSGTFAPFAIMLEVPGFTAKWYVRYDSEVYKDNPIILDIGLALSLTAAVVANVLIISRFLELARPRRATLIAIAAFVLHDVINMTALIAFGVIHAVSDGFTYSEAYWMTLGSTIASLLVTVSLIIDLRGTPNFRDAGSGLTQKQRELVIAVMAMLMFLSFSALIFNLLIKEIDFITALYFTVVTVTTVGFGDITPANTASRIVLMFVAPIGIVVVALVIATARRTILEEFENSYRRRREEYKKHHEERVQARKMNNAARAQVRRRSGRGGGGAQTGPTAGFLGGSALQAIQSGPMLVDVGASAIKTKAQAAGRGAAAAGRGASTMAGNVMEGMKHGMGAMLHGADKQIAKEEKEQDQLERVQSLTQDEFREKEMWPRETRTDTAEAPSEKEAVKQGYNNAQQQQQEMLEPSRPTPKRTGTLARWLPSPAALFPAEGFARNPVPSALNSDRGLTSSPEPFTVGGASDGSGESSITKEKTTHATESGGTGAMLDEVAALDASLLDQRKALESQWREYREGVRKSEKAEFVAKLSISFGLFIFFWILGAVIFMATEKWGFFISLYFCFVFFSTIGYGDFTPKTPAGRACFIVYALFGIGVLTILFAVVSDAWGNAFTNALKKTTKRGVISSQLKRISRRARPPSRFLKSKRQRRGQHSSEGGGEEVGEVERAPAELARDADEAEKGTRRETGRVDSAGSQLRQRRRGTLPSRRPTARRQKSILVDRDKDSQSDDGNASPNGSVSKKSVEAPEECTTAEELPLLIARSAMALQEHAVTTLRREELTSLMEALPDVANVVPTRFGGRAVVPNSSHHWEQLHRAVSEPQGLGQHIDSSSAMAQAADPTGPSPLSRQEMLRARRSRNEHMDALLDMIRRLQDPATSAAAEQAFAMIHFDDHLHDLLYHAEELFKTIKDLKEDNRVLKETLESKTDPSKAPHDVGTEQ